ncbi:MAG: HlyD family secretion protein [Thermodesulfobacteriota bacterium]
MSRKKGRPAAAVVAAAVVIVALFVYFYALRPGPPKDYVVSTGVMEATEVSLTPRISGRIEWMCCEEGDMVKVNEPAIRLEGTELRARLEEGKAAARAAAQEVSEARIRLHNARLGTESARFDVEAATAEVERSRALADEAKENLHRAMGLFKEGFIAKKDLDSARAAYDSSAALLSSARARLKGAGTGLANADVEIKAARVRISTAEARAKQSGAQVKVLESILSDAVVSSPINGVVSYKAFEPGEFVNTGAAVYTVYDLNDIRARVDIEETAVQLIRLGARAEVRALGVPGRVFAARVTEIGEVGGFATQRDVTRGRPDIKTFRVKAEVSEPGGFLKPGMTVEVRIYHDGAPGGG